MKLLFLYQSVSSFFMLFVPFVLGLRLLKGKEDKTRIKERIGWYTCKRPKGKLIWLHGASVGECLSMLPLIDKIIKENKKVNLLVTSGTVTSAKLMKNRLPKGVLHQYIPLDMPLFMARFLNHFKPDVALLFESELWPNMLCQLKRFKIKAGLINARMSEKSFQKWQKVPSLMTSLLSVFDFIAAQTEKDARFFKALGGKNVEYAGNLKFVAQKDTVDLGELSALQGALDNRFAWSALSTHRGEDEGIMLIHKALKKIYPSLITILSPRHPNRADEIKALAKKHTLKLAQRSAGEKIQTTTDIYLADTIGEYPLFYQLAPIIFIGGSLVNFGGQNMLEPMRYERAVITGPYTFNFSEIVKEAKEKAALKEVSSFEELQVAVHRFLKFPAEVFQRKNKALQFSSQTSKVLDVLYDKIERLGKLI